MEGINFDYKNRKRRQELGDQYLENGSIFIFRRDLIFNENNRLGGKMVPYTMPFWQSYEIDESEDMDICQYYIQKYVKQSLMPMSPSEFKLFVYDFDGVMTNNKATVNEHGEESVTVNRSDGLGISILKQKGKEQLILSTEENPVVSKRAKKLGLEVFHGISNKVSALHEILMSKGLNWREVLYIGNDINDLGCMEKVGFAVCPADAVAQIQSVSHLVLNRQGGEGVIRELADLVVDHA